MNADQLLQDLMNGAGAMNVIPCTVCRAAGKKLNHFHGSDWGKCIRYVWFDRKGAVPKEAHVGLNAMFLNDGHLHEALVLKSIQMAGHKISHRDTTDGEIEKTTVIAVPDQPPVHFLTIGHTDGVLNDEIVVECKAVKDWAWKNKFKQGLIPPTYFGQCQFYMYAHGKKKAFLIVKHRHTSEILIFDIPRDDTYLKERAVQLAGVEFALKHNLSIAVPFAEPTDECRFCPLWNNCWHT